MAKTARKPKAARLKKKPAGAPSWPADKIERRPIGELLSYPQNPMRHSEEQVGIIAESMREFGWTMPVLVDENGVLICGHGRIAAAQKLGLAEVPVMTATGWTEAQKKAYRIADNAIPRHGGATWDAAMLKIELGDLKLANYPLELLGFDDIALEAPAVVEPSPPAAPKKTGTIFVSVPTKRMGAARKVMAAALTAAGIEHNL
jgi:hypothetical protein